MSQDFRLNAWRIDLKTLLLWSKPIIHTNSSPVAMDQTSHNTSQSSTRCLYSSSFKDFIGTSSNEILGRLNLQYHGTTQTTTRDAWIGEIEILQAVLLPWRDEEAEIIFEFDIPRLGKRIDVVLLLRKMIFCLEFKVGKGEALQADVEQVMDYALDLKNFHQKSHDCRIVPILIPTKHEQSTSEFQPSVYDDSIYNPMITGENGLQHLLQGVIAHANAKGQGTIPDWVNSNYVPTPTIIEAARALYENHNAENITHHEADTTDAIKYIMDVINYSKSNGEKSICFVTGVPGAGKTLVGLDVAVKQSYQNGSFSEEDGAVYLSGNGPLVAVLTEALARDNYIKCNEQGNKKQLSDSRREVTKFIQMIHRYRDNMLAKIKNPVENGVLEIDPKKALQNGSSGYGEVEHVAIFDEAQRAWTHERLANYLKRGGTYGNKLKVPNFPLSEAAFLIWSLDQRTDWATIVCLVGGGQEINTGEAGIYEWLRALNDHFPHWKIFISDKLTEAEYAEGKVNQILAQTPADGRVTFSDQLHLAVSLRSFRAERLSSFVHSLLSFSNDTAEIYKDVIEHNYPIKLTRDINKARQWLRKQARGTQKTGILVSKVAARYKPQAVNILAQGDENAVHWFLEDKTDIRSSDYLEEAATEIQVQGLELDYACILWDADMRYSDGRWSFWKFYINSRWTPKNDDETRQRYRTKWIPERNEDQQKYMLNAYRVLLTRARQGIVICVPEGNSKITNEGFPEDSTRLPEYYDSTYKYLRGLGMEEL